MPRTSNIQIKNQHNHNQWIVNLFMFFFFVGISAQIGISSDVTTSETHFFSNELIFVGENTVLSIQTKNIVLNEDVTGDGLLHIGNTKEVALKTKTPITIKKIQIENTIVSLQSELAVTGKMHLKNAAIKLNDYNLITDENIFFEKESILIENGVGVWIQKKGFKQQIAGHNNSNNTQVITIPFVNANNIVAKRYNTKQFFLKDKTELVRIYFNIPKPPPKLV